MPSIYESTLALRGGIGELATGTAEIDCRKIGEIAAPSGELLVGDLTGIRARDCARIRLTDPGPWGVYVTAFRQDEREVITTVSATADPGRVVRNAGLPGCPPGQVDRLGVDGGVVGLVDAAAFELATDDDHEEETENYLLSGDLGPDGPVTGTLPSGGEVVVVPAGFGDGSYPVFAGYDADGSLVAVHVDFQIAYRPTTG